MDPEGPLLFEVASLGEKDWTNGSNQVKDVL